jgi:hypothetical protein
MADKPNDRVRDSAPAGDVPDPKVFFVVDGKKFGRPSLETYYAKTEDKQSADQTTVCSCNTVTGTYCSCNKVCSCNLVCTCQSVCSCQAVCSCVGYTSQGSAGSYCSCNKVCTCVPVH